MRYTYLGSRLTRPDLRGLQCDPVRREDGKCVVSTRMATALVVDADGRRYVVARRRLRLNSKRTMLADKDPIPHIIARVSETSGIREADIRSRKRTRPVADARHRVCWLARREGYTLEEIGQALGRHHASVIHSLEIAEYIDKGIYGYTR